MPVMAQRVPSGSYTRTCTNVYAEGSRVVADCQRTDGGWDRSALDTRGCSGGVANIDGQLTCNYGRVRGPRYGDDDGGWSRYSGRHYRGGWDQGYGGSWDGGYGYGGSGWYDGYR